MACTSVAVTSGDGGGGGGGGGQEGNEYKLILHVSTAWGDVAAAAAKLANWFSGISVFGYKLNQALLGGWDVTQVAYASDRIEISLKKIGSLPIVAVVTALIAAIRPILWLIGILITGWELLNLYTQHVEVTKSNNNLADDSNKIDQVKDMLDRGYTPEQIAKVLGVLNDKGTDWGSIVIPAVGLIAAAYIVGELFKSSSRSSRRA